MKIVRTFRELSKEIRRVPKIINRSSKEVATDVKDSFEVFANLYVPYNQGTLKKTIRPKKTKDGWEITAGSIGRNGFKVGHYTNMKWALDIKRPNTFFKVGQPKFRYGQLGVVSPSGRAIEWSKGGYKKGWWTRAAKDTNRMYGAERIARKITTRIKT